MKAAAAGAAPTRLRWTVKEYFRLSRMGFFGDRRVELINGDILQMPAQPNAHRTSVTKTANLLFRAFGSTDWVVVQGTLVLGTYAAPDPDFHVLDVPPGTPDKHLPVPRLVIEVSDTTYLKDSGPKLRLYARAGIPENWIVNLPLDRVEVYRQPENAAGGASGWRYGSVTFHARGDEVRMLRRPVVAFPVDAMLP